ncbi:MAG: nucleotide-binding universal stress UspA family protein [Vicingaceae bacterium]|jgi:nucleotide-binding universal stress UspA family protein
MNSILFPTDFSNNAKHAFQFAKMMAIAQRAQLILLHVYELPIVAPSNDFTTREQTMTAIDHDLRNAAHQHMKQYTNELDGTQEKYAVLIEEGNTATVISDFCSQEHINLVVMGTKGKTNNRDFIIGSITEKLIKKTQIPVLAIPELAEIRSFKKVVFATDLLYNSSDELKKVIDFTKLNNSSLTFLHIQTDSKNENNELVNLKEIIAQNKEHDLTFKTIIADTVAHGIESHLKENETDLLVLSNHTKSLFEKLFHRSISKQILLHSKVPLLILSKEIHPIVFF